MEKDHRGGMVSFCSTEKECTEALVTWTGKVLVQQQGARVCQETREK